MGIDATPSRLTTGRVPATRASIHPASTWAAPASSRSAPTSTWSAPASTRTSATSAGPHTSAVGRCPARSHYARAAGTDRATTPRKVGLTIPTRACDPTDDDGTKKYERGVRDQRMGHGQVIVPQLGAPVQGTNAPSPRVNVPVRTSPIQTSQ